MAKTYRPWAEMLALNQTSATTFTTQHPPERMGNALPIAYGGFALAVAVKAATLTLPSSNTTSNPTQPRYHLYSMSGHYLGPAKIDRPLHARVRIVRQTRTFATRCIDIFQVQDDGSERGCLIALADFQTPEPENLLEYSVSPSKKYSHYSAVPDADVAAEELVASGKVSRKLVDGYYAGFGLSKALFRSKYCPEGVFAQNLMGMAKTLPHSQQDLPLPQRTTADWVRSRTQLPSEMENVACLAFLMDGAIAFAPLSFSGMFLDDSAATSSLEFSLRLFRRGSELDLGGKWWLREIGTVVGAEGRTYSEGRLFDEGGVCVASMTQQSICRPKGKKGEKL